MLKKAANLFVIEWANILFVLGGDRINSLTYSWLITRFELVFGYPVIGVAVGALQGWS